MPLLPLALLIFIPAMVAGAETPSFVGIGDSGQPQHTGAGGRFTTRRWDQQCGERETTND